MRRKPPSFKHCVYIWWEFHHYISRMLPLEATIWVPKMQDSEMRNIESASASVAKKKVLTQLSPNDLLLQVREKLSCKTIRRFSMGLIIFPLPTASLRFLPSDSAGMQCWAAPESV